MRSAGSDRAWMRWMMSKKEMQLEDCKYLERSSPPVTRSDQSAPPPSSVPQRKIRNWARATEEHGKKNERLCE
jgi:hypothetical protein